jgi:hypothetical protein
MPLKPQGVAAMVFCSWRSRPSPSRFQECLRSVQASRQGKECANDRQAGF